MSAVVEPDHRLVPLPEAEHRRKDEHEDPPNDRHRGHRRIPVGRRVDVEGHRRGARKPLAAEGGEAGFHNGKVGGKLPGDPPEADADDTLPPEEEAEHDAEADTLAEEGCDGGAAGFQAKGEDKDWVERDVEHPAEREPHHRENRPPLGAQEVVEDKGAAHHRRAQQDVLGVVPGVGEDGGRRAEEVHQRVEEQKAQNRQKEPEGKGGEERGGAHLVGLVVLLLPQQPRNQAAGPHSQHEADGLDQRHQRKDDPDRPGRAGAELGDKVGVGHIVDGVCQHADDSRNRHRNDQPRDRRFDHLLILALLAGCVHRFFLLFCFPAGQIPVDPAEVGSKLLPLLLCESVKLHRSDFIEPFSGLLLEHPSLFGDHDTARAPVFLRGNPPDQAGFLHPVEQLGDGRRLDLADGGDLLLHTAVACGEVV